MEVRIPHQASHLRSFSTPFPLENVRAPYTFLFRLRPSFTRSTCTMATKKDWVKSLLTRSHSRPRNFENVKYNTMDSSKKIEEETLPYYKAEEFYPVHIGQVFEKKYQVLGKLGYGAFSTVWFCRDLSYVSNQRSWWLKLTARSKHRYVAIKVCTQSEDSSQQANRELKVYERLVKLGSTHPGTSYIRELIDHFELDGPHGRHTCLVQPPMHLTIHELQSHGTLDEALLRDILIRLLQALDFLHHEAHVIHTGMSCLWRSVVYYRS